MDTKAFGWLLALPLVLAPADVRAAQGEDIDDPAVLGPRLFAIIDLERPDLARVKALVEQKEYAGALAAYRDQFVARVAALRLGGRPGFWAWGYTDADELLKGRVGTQQYGERKVTRYEIGLPGRVQWNKIPEDGYDTVLRDLSTMHWVGKLIPAYETKKDPAYLRAWVGYWGDFGRNWLREHQRALRDPDLGKRVNNTIPWASKSLLYHGWRFEAFFTWLPYAMAVSPQQAREQTDPVALAHTLLHFATFEQQAAIYRMRQGLGTPNQFILCAMGLLKLAVALPELKEAPQWLATAEERILFYFNSSGYLADGTDGEQSFNYNPGLIGAVNGILELTENPPFLEQKPDWVKQLAQARDYRERFLSALPMPDGRTPSTGCDNHWGHNRERAAADYAKRKTDLPPLRARILSHILGDAALPAPTFTSIAFPYGGYVITRDGWRPESSYLFMKASRPANGHMREGGNGVQIASHGEYLLVNSCDVSYSKRGTYNSYFHSTVSQNSVSVDGYSQRLHGKPVAPPLSEPIPARWHTSERFDFAEGFFGGTYGGYNFRTNKREKDVSIEDVRHERQVIFLRPQRLWVITDRILSPGKHAYSQSWNFSPSFAEAEVAPDAAVRRIVTTRPGRANAGLYHFGTPAVTYRKHYGSHSETQTLGWVALETSEGVFTPAVDVHADWEAVGNQLLVTAICPWKGAAVVKESRELTAGGITGMELTLADGTRVTYLVSLEPAILRVGGLAAYARALLAVVPPTGRARGLVLDAKRLMTGGKEVSIAAPSFEFAWDGQALTEMAPVRVPETFRWEGEGGAIAPQYWP